MRRCHVPALELEILVIAVRSLKRNQAAATSRHEELLCRGKVRLRAADVLEPVVHGSAKAGYLCGGRSGATKQPKGTSQYLFIRAILHLASETLSELDSRANPA